MVVCRLEPHYIFHLASADPHLKRSGQSYYRIELQHIPDAFIFMFSCGQGVILQFNPNMCLPLNVGQDKKQLCEVLLLLLLVPAPMAGPVNALGFLLKTINNN